MRGAGPLVRICTTAERLQSGGFGTLAATPVNGYVNASTDLPVELVSSVTKMGGDGARY